MERKLALLVGVPFLGIAWSLIAVVAFAPGLINGRLLMLLLLALSITGIVIMLIRIAVRDRENSLLSDTLYPFVGILVAIGIGFHEQIGAAARGVVDYVTLSNPVSEGMRFTRADDQQFHIRLMVEGNAVDFLVDLGTPFNVMMPDVPKQVGISPSSLIYDERVDLAVGGDEYAAHVVLPKVQLGTTVLENLPFKVFATSRWRNILGRAFLDRFKSWRIDGDTLILAQ